MNKADLRLTILGCFRYSLGRMTYMPSHTVTIIKENEHLFNRADWFAFIREIDLEPNLGMACDKKQWGDLREFARNKLNSQTNEETKK